jgi:hypothetical protein
LPRVEFCEILRIRAEERRKFAMRRLVFARRFVLIVAAMGGVGVTGVGGVSATSVPKITCAKLSLASSVFKGCTLGETGGKSTSYFPDGGYCTQPRCSITTTWANGRSTSWTWVSAPVFPNVCPGADYVNESKVSGIVTDDTSGYAVPGGKVSGFTCFDDRGGRAATLAPGTHFTWK